MTDDGRVPVFDPTLVAAVHQPLCTYPTDELGRLCRLMLDVHVLRLLAWYVDRRAPHYEPIDDEQERTNQVRQIGLAFALKNAPRQRVSVTRRQYEQMRDEGWKVEMEQDGETIHFQLLPSSPRRKPRRRQR